MHEPRSTGPLTGIRVVELAGLGAAPFGAMLLADLGADVVRVARPGAGGDGSMGAFDVLHRNRDVVEVDAKSDDGRLAILALVERADAFVEGFRPGVTERLGLGPDDCLARNPALVYGRLTGWGQDGPLSQTAGHDLTYASVAGAIGHIGRRDAPPTPPLNLVADNGGGGMLLALGLTAALLHAKATGEGQVVDAAMVDGVALLLGPLWGASASGFWNDERGTNLLDSGAPFYDCYPCADDGYLAVAAIEPAFYVALLDGLGLDPDTLPPQQDPDGWPSLRQAIGDAIVTKSLDEWCAIFDGTDACVAPVLTMGQAAEHPHLRARGTVVAVDGAPQPAPAPRFSATPTAPIAAARAPIPVADILSRWSDRAEA